MKAYLSYHWSLPGPTLSVVHNLSTMATESNGHGEAVYTVPLVISGLENITSTTFEVVSPDTGKVVHRASSASVEDAASAVDSCARAFLAWRSTLPKERRDIFLRAADIMDRRRDELAQYLMDETGGNRLWADFNLDVGIDLLKDIAGRIPSVQGMLPGTADPRRTGMVVKEPYGVVLAIAPWYVECSVPSTWRVKGI